MNKRPLYQQPIEIPSWKPVPLALSCQPVGGSNAIPQNHKPTPMGLRQNDRLSKRARVGFRGLTEVGLTSGLTAGSKRGVAQTRTYSAAEKRRLAIRVLKERGEAINGASIAGILSGKTL